MQFHQLPKDILVKMLVSISQEHKEETENINKKLAVYTELYGDLKCVMDNCDSEIHDLLGCMSCNKKVCYIHADVLNLYLDIIQEKFICPECSSRAEQMNHNDDSDEILGDYDLYRYNHEDIY